MNELDNIKQEAISLEHKLNGTIEMTTVVENITVLEHSIQVFVFTIADLIKEGWEIDPNLPPASLSFAYECGLIKTTEVEKEAHEKATAPTKRAGRPPKAK